MSKCWRKQRKSRHLLTTTVQKMYLYWIRHALRNRARTHKTWCMFGPLKLGHKIRYTYRQRVSLHIRSVSWSLSFFLSFPVRDGNRHTKRTHASLILSITVTLCKCRYSPYTRVFKSTCLYAVLRNATQSLLKQKTVRGEFFIVLFKLY